MSRLVAPASLAEALDLLAEPGTHPIAGGVAVLLRARLGEPPGARHVAIAGLAELRSIRVEPDGALAVGAAVTLAELAASSLAWERAPLLAAAASAAASVGMRSTATVGGNLVDAPGDSDLAAAAGALDGELAVASRGGSRRAALGEPIGAGELVTALLVRAPAGVGWGLERLRTQGAADRPAVTLALVLHHDGAAVAGARAVATFVADRPIRLEGIGRAIEGEPLPRVASGSLDDRIAATALADVDARVADGTALHDDVRASAAYRRAMIGVLAARAVADAAGRADERRAGVAP